MMMMVELKVEMVERFQAMSMKVDGEGFLVSGTEGVK